MARRTDERVALPVEHHEQVMQRLRVGGFLGVSLVVGLSALLLL